jgi:putative MFS transporter
VAYLYGRWSSKKTMVLFGLLTALSLVGIAVLGNTAVTNHGLLILLVAGVLVAANGVIAMLTPYASEVYPTSIRGTGTGYAAGASKAGGIAGPYLVVGVAALSSGLAAAALVVAIPITLASGYLAWTGVETRGRSLEDISAGELLTDPTGTGIRAT